MISDEIRKILDKSENLIANEDRIYSLMVEYYSVGIEKEYVIKKHEKSFYAIYNEIDLVYKIDFISTDGDFSVAIILDNEHIFTFKNSFRHVWDCNFLEDLNERSLLYILPCMRSILRDSPFGNISKELIKPLISRITDNKYADFSMLSDPNKESKNKVSSINVQFSDRVISPRLQVQKKNNTENGLFLIIYDNLFDYDKKSSSLTEQFDSFFISLKLYTDLKHTNFLYSVIDDCYCLHIQTIEYFIDVSINKTPLNYLFTIYKYECTEDTHNENKKSRSSHHSVFESSFSKQYNNIEEFIDFIIDYMILNYPATSFHSLMKSYDENYNEIINKPYLDLYKMITI